eukprot:8413361-Lingulodinium_polyedra.AAC.1
MGLGADFWQGPRAKRARRVGTDGALSKRHAEGPAAGMVRHGGARNGGAARQQGARGRRHRP